MGHNKLKTKLRLDSGKDISDEKTAELIVAHKTVFSKYWDWVYDISRTYKDGNPLSTSDGWILFCDNPVITSVRNFLVQATAASITRRAVILATEARLKVLCSLHDAIYIISDSPDWHKEILENCMLLATAQILKEQETNIRLDFKTISHEEVWIEEKGQKDWDKLKRYLT